MEPKEILYATHTGMVTIGNQTIPCAVLNNGERVFIQREIVGLLTGNKKGGFERYLKANNLQPYLPDKFKDNSLAQSVYSFKIGSRIAQGFVATDLIDICMMYINAKNDNKLLTNQTQLAVQSLVIVSAFAKTGVIAVIDEATGYQYDREKDALQVILQAFISNELLKWQKMFPDSFYYEIFRLKRWDYTVSGIKKRPSVIGTWTKKLIYEQLPKGVLEELLSKTPKSPTGNYTARFFQSLTPDIGHPALTAQIYKVIGLMNASSNWEEFNALFNRMVNKNNGEQELDFNAIEMDIVKASAPDAKDLSLFDKLNNQ